MTFYNVVLAGAITCTALMAGLFFSYSCSIVLGFKTLADPQYIMAMQAINRAIQNPVFFIIFFDCLVLLPLCTYLKYPGYDLENYSTFIKMLHSIAFVFRGNASDFELTSPHLPSPNIFHYLCFYFVQFRYLSDS